MKKAIGILFLTFGIFSTFENYILAQGAPQMPSAPERIIHQLDNDQMPFARCAPENPFAERKVLATSDGGVVIIIGDKILKYDAKLNLVKSAKLPSDFDALQDKMRSPMMMKGCPMMNKRSAYSDGKPASNPAAATKSIQE